jgi:EmrB/QacA subfamily drug resistance transporter
MARHTVPAPVADRNPSRRWWALAALALSGLTIGLDTTVLTIALPELAASLHATTGQLQWFSTAYTLTVGAAMLPASNLGDRYGRKRMLVGALVLFGGASLWCALAGSPGSLIAARALLGLAGAALMPLGFAMLPVLFPEREERDRAVLLWTTASTLGLPLGPIVGGWLLNHFWWGSVFLLNVPLAAVGALLLAAFLPEARSTRPVRLDLLGAALSSAGLVALIYGSINAGQHGWTDTGTWAPALAGVALLAAFTAWERACDHPLIDLGLFRDAGFSWGTAHATIANFALFGLLFAVPQYFQSVGGSTPLGTGLRLLPMIGGMIVATQFGGRFARRYGPRALITAGFVLAAAALAAAATTSVGTGYGFAAAWIAVLGAGIGLALPAAMSGALGAVSAERAGAGSGLLQAMRQVGGTIGVAVLGTVLSSGYRGRLHTGRLAPDLDSSVHAGVSAGVRAGQAAGDGALVRVVRAAFVHGMDVMLLVSAGTAAAGAVLALLFFPRGDAQSPAGAGETGEAAADTGGQQGADAATSAGSAP